MPHAEVTGPTSGRGLLIVLRHGESTWNRDRRFTGWADPPLTGRGAEEATAAGRALARTGLLPDAVVTSVLHRAVDTAQRVVAALPTAPSVTCDWRLNERHYGDLQGRSHEEVRRRYGDAVVTSWRRSWADRPPPLPADDPRAPRRDPRYAAVPDAALPNGESLADCLARQLPVLTGERIGSAVRAGARVLIVGHGNSLRALVAHLERIPPERVPDLLVPTGEPIVFAFDGRWRRQRISFGVHGTRHGP